MTVWLSRNGFGGVSKHTVDRLMRQLGMRGLVRGRGIRTTVAATHGTRAGDLLRRCFNAPRPNHAWVTDFTYVATWAGFVYVAFAIDLYSRAIVGWSASTVKDTTFVENCLRMALWRREHSSRPVPAGMIHHSDAGSQGEFNRLSQHLDYGGLRWSAVRSRCLRRQRVHGGSGRRIGLYDRRCVHRDDRSRLVRCSGTSGGRSRQA
jgi:transposase InsO family protein